MHVVVGRPSVAINMHSVAISIHSVAISIHSVRNPTTHLHARGSWDPLCCNQVAISGHQWPSMAISGTHLHARGSWDPLCSPLTMVWRG
jgi:hypothetical protein